MREYLKTILLYFRCCGEQAGDGKCYPHSWDTMVGWVRPADGGRWEYSPLQNRLYCEYIFSGCEIKEGQLYGYQMYGEYSLDTKEDVESSSACSNICRVTTGCDLWTWTVIPVGQIPAIKCFLKKGRSGGVRMPGLVSGYTFCAPWVKRGKCAIISTYTSVPQQKRFV